MCIKGFLCNFFILFLFIGNSVDAQPNFIGVPSSFFYNSVRPVKLSGHYSYGQFILAASDLDNYGLVPGSEITSIRLYTSANPSTFTSGYNTFDLYGTLTTKEAFSSKTDWVVSGLNLLFSGQGTPESQVLISSTQLAYPYLFTFSTPLIWDGTSNIIFSIDESVYGKSSGTINWVNYNVSKNQMIVENDDYNNINPTNPTTAAFIFANLPATVLTYSHPTNAITSSVSSPSSPYTLPQNSTIQVLPAVNIDVGALDLNGSSLVLNSNSSGYGQLKFTSISGSGSVKQENQLSEGHHGISSPMTAGFTTTSGTNGALYGYNASTGAWDMSPTTSAVGAGFFAPVQASSGFQSAAGSFSVTGTPNTSHTHSLDYAANTATNGSGSGWNLIGNPYTCSLNWTSVTITKTNVNNAYYVWDASAGTYQYYSGSALSGTYLAASSILSGVIPPMQAFWVQATASGGSIVSSMANDGTVASSPTFYKTTPDNLILYAEDLSDPSYSDAMWITHASGYTNDFEGDQDAWKRSNYGGQANIYSYHNGENMAINATDLSTTTSIPVGVKGTEAGKKYRIVLEQLVNNQDYQVVLEDKLANSFTDITSEGYVFTYGTWQNEDPRFVLHINQSTVGMGEQTSQEVKVYQQGDRMIIHGDAQKHSSFKLLSIDGRLLETGILQAGMTSIQAPQAGMYIIQIEGVSPIAQRVVIQ